MNEPIQVTLDPGLLRLVVEVVLLAVAWFGGQWYKVRRLQGIPREQLLEELGISVRDRLNLGLDKLEPLAARTSTALDEQVLASLRRLLQQGQSSSADQGAKQVK